MSCAYRPHLLRPFSQLEGRSRKPSDLWHASSFAACCRPIPTLLGVSVISFAIVYNSPGDPILIRTFDPNITPESREILRRQLGLDQHWTLQYVGWLTGITLRRGDVAQEFTRRGTGCTYVAGVHATICDNGGGILRGNMGTSIATNQAVWDRLTERMPATLRLGFWALLVSLVVGVSLGVLSAVHQGSILDNALRVLAVMGNALPNFWFGLLLILVFGVVLGWLPTGGRQSVSLTNEFDLVDRLRHLVLPTLVLAFGGIASFSRYMRTETLEVIRTDYIRMARAKGLAARRVWFIHALRNALIPLMTILGPGDTGHSIGRSCNGDRLLLAGYGAVDLQRCRTAGLPHGFGRGDVFLVVDDPGKPAFRHTLRRRGSPSAAGLNPAGLVTWR